MILKPSIMELVLFKFYYLKPNYPFKLLTVSRSTFSLKFIITFTNINVILQDRSSGQKIGVECESQGLYYLSVSSKTCSTKDYQLSI